MFVSEMIGDDFKNWHHGQSIYLSAGTGTGKTFFLAHVWAEYLKHHGSEKILYLSNRSALHEQTRNDLSSHDQSFEDRATYETRTFQSLESAFLKGDQAEIDYLNTFENIFIDEAHYFFVDSAFNRNTNLPLRWLLSRKDSCCLVWASGTGKSVFSEGSWLRSVCPPSQIYDVSQIYGHVDRICFFKGSSGVLAYHMSQFIERTGRSAMLITNDSAEIRAVHKHLKERYSVSVVFSTSNKGSQLKGFKSVSEDCRKILTDRELQENGENFPFKVLLATTTIDTGINIKDRRLGAIFVDLIEPEPIVQALGRKRPLDPDDTVSFFVSVPPDNKIKNSLLDHEKAFEQAELFQSDPAGFAEKYLRFPASCLFDQEPIIRQNLLTLSDRLPSFEIDQARFQRLVQKRDFYKQIEETDFKSFLLDGFLKPLKGKQQDLPEPDPADLNSFLNDYEDRMIRYRLAERLESVCFDEKGEPIPICATPEGFESKGKAAGYLDPDVIKRIFKQHKTSAMKQNKYLDRASIQKLHTLSGLTTYTIEKIKDPALRIRVLKLVKKSSAHFFSHKTSIPQE